MQDVYSITKLTSLSIIENFWEFMSQLPVSEFRPFSDQTRYNCAFKALNMQWNFPDPENTHSTGHSKAMPELNITLLPHRLFCRLGHCRTVRSELYLWHKGGPKNQKAKKDSAKGSALWFLKNNWRTDCMNGDLVREKWLRCISQMMDLNIQ